MRAVIVVLAACSGGSSSSNDASASDGGEVVVEATACPATRPEVIDVELGFAADATHFYFTPTQTELARRPIAGGAVEKLADLPGSIDGPITLGTQHVLGVAGGVAFRVAKTGGAPESLGAVTGQIGKVASDGDALYVATIDDALELRRAGTVGGPTTLLADASTDGVEELASDGVHLYWAVAERDRAARADRRRYRRGLRGQPDRDAGAVVEFRARLRG